MAGVNGTLTFVDKNGDDKFLIKVIENSTEVKIGSHPSNDIMIKSEDVEELHCKIFCNEINRVCRNFHEHNFCSFSRFSIFFSIMAGSYNRQSFPNFDFNSFFNSI
jgi:hypothetical protein